MNTGRLILLGVALLAGGGAFFLVASGDDTPEVITQAIPQQETIETVRVLVADTEFAQGERLDPKKTKWVKWPKKGLPDFLVTDENKTFYEELSLAVARTTIVAGEPITEAKIVHPGSQGMLAALLTPGMRAVTMDVSSRQSAAGFILPGDRVDVFATLDNDDGTSMESGVLYSNIRVLAVDQTMQQDSEGAIVGRTVTLELAPSQVARFLTARESGSLNLALRSVFRPADGEELIQEVEPAEVLVIRYGQS